MTFKAYQRRREREKKAHSSRYGNRRNEYGIIWTRRLIHNNKIHQTCDIWGLANVTIDKVRFELRPSLFLQTVVLLWLSFRGREVILRHVDYVYRAEYEDLFKRFSFILCLFPKFLSFEDGTIIPQSLLFKNYWTILWLLFFTGIPRVKPAGARVQTLFCLCDVYIWRHYYMVGGFAVILSWLLVDMECSGTHNQGVVTGCTPPILYQQLESAEAGRLVALLEIHMKKLF